MSQVNESHWVCAVHSSSLTTDKTFNSIFVSFSCFRPQVMHYVIHFSADFQPINESWKKVKLHRPVAAVSDRTVCRDEIQYDLVITDFLIRFSKQSYTHSRHIHTTHLTSDIYLELLHIRRYIQQKY